MKVLSSILVFPPRSLPPHTSFYLGVGMKTPSRAKIKAADAK